MTSPQIQQILDRLAGSSFRARFHLGAKEQEILRDKGLEVIRRHANELIAARLAPAFPRNDGKQTPWRGHPVFVAQHATATCCRSCLAKWHDIARGHELTAAEREYVMGVIVGWVERERLRVEVG